ncbi:hypothetical protein ACFOY4_09855 [Actinomadura syzygii]|uniref:Uncharacterized protein n=1 Tax=Actinomadura syzygii TaxID=1427538 RepID=A0A5D0UCS3_9ACTN|nr:hypothetical protein [Actinomadura syzygii]TYC15877.1 hypothetical protein FXF65_11085 [Actinomadura syzygii]
MQIWLWTASSRVMPVCVLGSFEKAVDHPECRGSQQGALALVVYQVGGGAAEAAECEAVDGGGQEAAEVVDGDPRAEAEVAGLDEGAVDLLPRGEEAA